MQAHNWTVPMDAIIHELDIINPLDSWLSTTYAMLLEFIPDARLLFALLGYVPFFNHALLSIIFDCIDQYDLLPQCKIDSGLRGDASKPDAKVTSEAKKQAVMTLVLGLPMGFMGAAFDAWLVPGMHSKELPSVVVMAAQVVAAFIILDFVYYWGHGSLHHESFYFMHKVHHQYHAVNTWAAPYMHPLEGVGALIMLSFISWLIRMHGLAKFIFILLFGMLSAYQHTGYDLPFIPLEISRFHVFHHSHNVGAYGVITTFWDRVFGTDKPYRRWRQKQLQPVP